MLEGSAESGFAGFRGCLPASGGGWEAKKSAKPSYRTGPGGDPRCTQRGGKAKRAKKKTARFAFPPLCVHRGSPPGPVP